MSRAEDGTVDSTRKAFFEHLVRDRGDLERAAEDSFLEGERLLTTAHAVYRLLDGVCIGVDDMGMTGRPQQLVGMTVVGWIPLSGDAIIDSWEPGAAALFARQPRSGQSSRMALTSAVIELGLRAPSGPMPKARESYVRETRVSVPRPDVSFGRQKRSSVNNIHALLTAQRRLQAPVAAAAGASGPGTATANVTAANGPASKAPPLPPHARFARAR